MSISDETVQTAAYTQSNESVERHRKNVHREFKKQNTKFLPITSPNVNRFQNSSTARLVDKFETQIFYHTLHMSVPYLVKYKCQ